MHGSGLPTLTRRVKVLVLRVRTPVKTVPPLPLHSLMLVRLIFVWICILHKDRGADISNNMDFSAPYPSFQKAKMAEHKNVFLEQIIKM